MKPTKFGKQFAAFYEMALQLAVKAEADGVIVMVDQPTEWEHLVERSNGQRIIIAADGQEQMAGASEAGLPTIELDMDDSPMAERVTQALIEAVADEFVPAGSSVVAVYSGFELGKIDSVSFVRLHEHLGRLTSRDLQKIETHVPLDTLKTIVDLAVEIGREGREGKPVGTMLVVGDVRKVMMQSHEAVWDPVRGYNRKERNLHETRNRDAVKEIAQLDGAFVISADGTVEASCRIIDTSPVELTLTKGLGSRHWAAAAISKNTKAIAIVVSESNGTVRIFQDGEVILRIEPLRRPMRWRGFDSDAPQNEGGVKSS
ncbi:DNA integrity scanning protein DisA nucleotide-binding domain protein [Lignipirellula cremea]|uniref:DNA integrity scanning protein DisA n=1 Tax=Lignipirellula cremea TaxID=2528010 RepID=A0A518DPJ1_9BACT|nr:diadenylate cyclase [Lignipirellula cremea]QDU93733.1 DNA integrity scanning protein DisA [Lignipirellula cremea]